MLAGMLSAAVSFRVTPSNIEIPVVTVVEKLVEGCYRIHKD